VVTGSHRALLFISGFALVASAAFSVGEISGAHHHRSSSNQSPTNGSGSQTTVTAGASGVSLSGLSISKLQDLQRQVTQAAAQAQSEAANGSVDLAQLEAQLGLTPSPSTAGQLQQLQTELSSINACLSGSSSSNRAC